MPPKFITAIQTNNLEEVEKALIDGTDVNTAYDGMTPLEYAIESSNVEAVKLLIDNGANVKYGEGEFMPTPLLWAAAISETTNLINNERKQKLIRNLQIAELLIEKGANVNPTKDGANPLPRAIGGKDCPLVELLVKKGANVNATENGRTMLTQAANTGHYPMIKILIEEGAKVSVDALQEAISGGNVQIAKLLIGHILLQNPAEEKPSFIQTTATLSLIWDKQVEKIKQLLNDTSLSEETGRRVLNKLQNSPLNSLLFKAFQAYRLSAATNLSRETRPEPSR